MGSWNATCGLTNLPIIAGDEVVACFIAIPQIGSSDKQTVSYYAGEIRPITPCFTGTYDDYGRVENIKLNSMTLAIANQFGFTNETFDELIALVNGEESERIEYPNKMQDYYSSVYDGLKTKQDNGELDVKQHPPDKVEKYGDMKKLLEDHPDLVGLWMCRKDYLDQMMNTKLKWEEFSKVKSYKLSESMEKDRKHLFEFIRTTEEKSISMTAFSMTEKLEASEKRSHNQFFMFMYVCSMAYDFGDEIKNVMMEQAFEELKTKKESVFANELFDGLAYLASIYAVMFATRNTWKITSHAGSQAENFEMHLASAKAISSIAKARIAERKEQDKEDREEEKKWRAEEKAKKKKAKKGKKGK